MEDNTDINFFDKENNPCEPFKAIVDELAKKGFEFYKRGTATMGLGQ